MLKRLVAFMLALVLTTVSFSGCNRTNNEDTKDDSSTQVKNFEPSSKKIKVAWLQQYWQTKEDLQYIFDGFSAKYPEYELEIVYNLGETSKLLAEIQSNNQPDVYLGADPNWATYVAGCYQRLFKPLDDYLTYDADYNFDTVPKNLLDTTKFSPDGRYYAIPYALSAYCLAYNKSLYEKVGLDPNDPPETWSEWLNYNNQLIKTDSKGVVEQIGLRADGPYGYIISPLRKHDVFSDDGLKSNYNQQWVNDDGAFAAKFDDKYNEKLPKDVEFSFINGNVGMDENINLFDLSALTTSGIDFDIALLPRPDDYTERVVPALLWMYVSIPTGAKNPNGGWLFAKYACTDGLMKEMEKRATDSPKNFTPSYIIHTPTRERAYELYMKRVDDKTKAIIEKRDQLISQINYVLPYPPIQAKKGIVLERWSEKYRKGEVTAAGMFEGIHKEMEQEFASWRKEMEAQGWNFPADGKPYFKKK